MRLGGRYVKPVDQAGVVGQSQADGSLVLEPTAEGAPPVIIPPQPPDQGAYTLAVVDGEWVYQPVPEEGPVAVVAAATAQKPPRGKP